MDRKSKDYGQKIKNQDRKSKEYGQKIKRIWIENQKTMDRKSKDQDRK